MEAAPCVRLVADPPSGLSESAVCRGDAATVLRSLAPDFFQCCITSPPYWGLRDYGIEGQVGAEEDPDDYVVRLTEVFEQVRRVLRPDGTLWLNVGDSYTSGNRAYRAPDKKHPVREMRCRPRTPRGLKEKELVGVPWRLAFSLQDCGWYLRADIIWDKPNCMPESVKDRPTRAHEYLFLFSKSPNYLYNADAIREFNGRNRRSVWSVPTEPFRGAHFATFPLQLIEPCVLAGAPPASWVLDPFFGSGTVGVACVRQHRKYFGIELNPAYVEMALARIRETSSFCSRSAPESSWAASERQSPTCRQACRD
ncbi:MAG: site-specific DNA-methyltransferase [Acidobacteriota bacterium]